MEHVWEDEELLFDFSPLDISTINTVLLLFPVEWKIH